MFTHIFSSKLVSILLIIYYINSVRLKTDFNSMNDAIIQSRNGRIRGKSFVFNKRINHLFRGIPYAMPPIGDLRFRKPVSITSQWPGIYDATQYKCACMQPNSMEIRCESEDCLYLNVWTPSVNASHSALPVMIYVHGGFWTSGSAVSYDTRGTNTLDGTQLASKGVIVVTINHRLGVFGFLFGDCDKAPGNMGLWDQVLAIEWVIHNIRAFGGNPYDITLFGHSSGSMSISCLSLSPISRDLFQKVIMQSGASYPKHRLSPKSDAFQSSKQFATNNEYFGSKACNPSNDFIDCLKNKRVEELDFANEMKWRSAKKDNKFFKPLFGDQLIPQPLFAAISDGQFNPYTNFMVGHNQLEGLDYEFTLGNNQSQVRYNPKEDYIENISKQLVERDISDEFVWIRNRTIQLQTAQLYSAPFSLNRTELLIQQNSLKVSALQAFGDCLTQCPTVIFGADFVRNRRFKGNVFQYRLTYANTLSMAYGSKWASATHTDELPLMFGRPLNRSQTFWSDRDRFLSHHMVNIWTFFAKNGYPPTLNGNAWMPYRSAFDGSVVTSYVELNPELWRLGRIVVNAYKGNDGYNPSIINNCLNYWKHIYINEYMSA